MYNIGRNHNRNWGFENNQLPQLKGISLDVLINDHGDVISMIKSLCYQLTDKQLNQQVEYENGNEATIKWGIWHMADHNRYHQAHISLGKWFSQSWDVRYFVQLTGASYYKVDQ